MWSGTGPRETRLNVTFSERSATLPVVHLAMSMWDTDGDTNQRADLRAEAITDTGFEIVFRTWGDSRVARIRADWMAIGEVGERGGRLGRYGGHSCQGGLAFVTRRPGTESLRAMTRVPLSARADTSVRPAPVHPRHPDDRRHRDRHRVSDHARPHGAGGAGDLAQGSIWAGVLMAAYAGAQFLFAPVVGSLSDAFGRRPVLLAALALLALDYVIMALAGTLWLLIVGRTLAGLAGATYITATAYVADISSPGDRAARFGLIGAAFGIGFVIGPGPGRGCRHMARHRAVLARGGARRR
jgi:hypothetical protein